MPQNPIKNWHFRDPRRGDPHGEPRPLLGRASGTLAVNVDYVQAGSGGGGGPSAPEIVAFTEVRYVNIHGDVMTGPEWLTLWADPAQPMHAATKQYVDSKAAALDAGLGLTIDPATLPNPTINLDPATDTLLGGLTEPLPDGIAHTRQYDLTNGVWRWVPAVTAGLQITGLIPAKALFGAAEPDVTVHAYGAMFTATTEILLDGVPVVPPAVLISASEMTFIVKPSVETAYRVVSVTVRDGATIGAGAEAFEFVTGLEIAGNTPPEVGIVYVPARTPGQGLELSTDGGLRAPIATPDHAGSITEPREAGKPFARQRDATTGLSSWVEVEAGGMEEPPASPVALWGRTSAGARGWLEIPPPPEPGIGDVPPDPPIVWGRATGRWMELPDTTVEAGRGLSKDDKTLHLDVATAAELGGVFVPGQQGLELTQVGGLTLARATPEVIGGLQDAPRDDTGLKSYSRKWGEWVEATSSLTFERGLTEENGAVTLDIATPIALGGVFVPGQQGLELTQAGGLTLAPATPEIIGGLVDAPRDDTGTKQFARKWGEWVEVSDSGGMTEPPAEPVAIWGRSSAGARGWLEVPTFDHINGKVDKIGDTMTGKLTLDGPPTQPLHAATKDYVDLSEPQEAPHNGKQYARQDGQWVEVEQAPGGGISDVPVTPVQAWARANGRWVDVPQQDITGKVDKIGDTMSGPLTLHGPPTQPRHAVTMDWADLTFLKEAPKDQEIYGRKGGLWEPVPQIDQKVIDDKVNVYGDTMTGPLVLSGPPTQPLHATTKDWVDLNFLKEAPTDGLAYCRINASWDALPAALQDVPKALDAKVDRIGDTMTGPLVLSGAPTQPLHAVTMDWVDLNFLKDAPKDGKAYGRQGGLWKPVGGVTVGEVAPANPDQGDLWWDSSTGETFIWYDDGTSKQWVQQAPGTGGGAARGVEEAPIDGTPYSRQDGVWTPASAGVTSGDAPPANPRPNSLWFESDTGALFVFYDDGTSKQWVEVGGSSASTAVDLTGYATQTWVQTEISNAVIDTQAYVRGTATAVKHDADACAQALAAVEAMAITIKRLERRIKVLEGKR